MSSSGGGLAVATTASFPNPAQDYYEPMSLDRELIRKRSSTFILRVTSDALASQGILAGDELIVDRSLQARPGLLIVVLLEGERRLGRFEVRGGRAVLVTDDEVVALDETVEPWGVPTIQIHHLLKHPEQGG